MNRTATQIRQSHNHNAQPRMNRMNTVPARHHAIATIPNPNPLRNNCPACANTAQHLRAHYRNRPLTSHTAPCFSRMFAGRTESGHATHLRTCPDSRRGLNPCPPRRTSPCHKPLHAHLTSNRNLHQCNTDIRHKQHTWTMRTRHLRAHTCNTATRGPRGSNLSTSPCLRPARPPTQTNTMPNPGKGSTHKLAATMYPHRIT